MVKCLFHFRKSLWTLNVNRPLGSSPCWVLPPLPFALWHALQFICSLYINSLVTISIPPYQIPAKFPSSPLDLYQFYFPPHIFSWNYRYFWLHITLACVSVINIFQSHLSSSLSHSLNSLHLLYDLTLLCMVKEVPSQEAHSFLCHSRSSCCFNRISTQGIYLSYKGSQL